MEPTVYRCYYRVTQIYYYKCKPMRINNSWWLYPKQQQWCCLICLPVTSQFSFVIQEGCVFADIRFFFRHIVIPPFHSIPPFHNPPNLDTPYDRSSILLFFSLSENLWLFFGTSVHLWYRVVAISCSDMYFMIQTVYKSLFAIFQKWNLWTQVPKNNHNLACGQYLFLETFTIGFYTERASINTKT